jgi:hypothetical protein
VKRFQGAATCAFSEPPYFQQHSIQSSVSEAVMGRPVVHWEFWSEDPGKIAEFYEKVFD